MGRNSRRFWQEIDCGAFTLIMIYMHNTEGKKPLFSIVTVTYNCESTIQNTIESVICQTDADYEYIIIDGNSSDDTLKQIAKYKQHITTLISEPDSGIYDAMNKGIALSNGEWILFLNSGDFFSNRGALGDVTEHLKESRGGGDIVYGDIYIDRKSERILKIASEPCNKHRMYFCHQSAFVRTEIMKKIGFDATLKMSADLLFFKTCYYAQYKFRHIPVPVVVYDRNGISNTNRIEGLRENLRVIRMIDRFPVNILYYLRLQVVIQRIRLVTLLKRFL